MVMVDDALTEKGILLLQQGTKVHRVYWTYQLCQRRAWCAFGCALGGAGLLRPVVQMDDPRFSAADVRVCLWNTCQAMTSEFRDGGHCETPPTHHVR